METPMPEKPNVIVCICDQLRSFEVGCYGNRSIRTSNIDRLGSEGARFDVAVTNNPVCMPARSALLSGQYSRTCMGHIENDHMNVDGKGVLEPHDPEYMRGCHLPGKTLAEGLRESGYETAAIGKWHIRPAPDLIGFDYSLLPITNHVHSGQEFRENGGEPRPVEGFSIDYEIESVENYLAASHEKPFFLYYSIMPPHMPVADMPEKYLNMYLPDDVPLRPNVYIDGKLPYSEGWFLTYLWDFMYYHEKAPHTLNLPEGFDLKTLTALYYGATTWVDDTVGRLMRALETNRLAENTVVVFTSDHGDNLGSHHEWNKGLLIDESIRIPMIYWAPGRWRNRVVTSQVAQTIDIMPTVLDICGANIPEPVQGRSLAPVVTGQVSELADTSCFIETPLWMIGVRTPRHMYGLQLDDNGSIIEGCDRWFYDIYRDPFEYSNLLNTGEQRELADALCARLEAWHGDTSWLKDDDVNPDRTHLFDQNSRWKDKRL